MRSLNGMCILLRSVLGLGSDVVSKWRCNDTILLFHVVIGQLCGAGTIGQLWGTGTIGQLCGAGTIGQLCGTGTIGQLCGTGTIAKKEAAFGISNGTCR